MYNVYETREKKKLQTREREHNETRTIIQQHSIRRYSWTKTKTRSEFAESMKWLQEKSPMRSGCCVHTCSKQLVSALS